MKKQIVFLTLCLCLLTACSNPFVRQWKGVVTEESLAALDHYTRLKSADLRGSDCQEAIAAWQSAHPEVSVLYDVDIGGSRADFDTAELRLQPGGWTLEGLCAAAPWLPELRLIDFGEDILTPEELSALREACPRAELVSNVDIGGGSAACAVRELRLKPDAWTVEGLCAAAPWLPELRLIDTGGAGLTPAELSALQEACPGAEILAPIAALGREFTGEETELDLSGVDPQRVDETCALLHFLPKLEKIETVGADGESRWQLEELSRLREAASAGAEIDCRFQLFGQTVSSGDEEIEYYRNQIGDENLPVLRQALPLLTSCRRLLLDDCDLSYEKLAELREEFPERNLVWRVRFGVDSVLTDTQRIWSIYVTNENCDVLKYCTEVLYFDVGHTLELSDFHFIPYMTKLPVLIVARTGFSDCELLTHCPDLEYLEIFSSEVTDLTPLAKCTSLEHLNIANLQEVTDISPLYGLTNLKRLRICLDNVPEDQKEEITRRLPNCEMMFYAVNPTDNGWRRNRLDEYVPRYALLREQLGYDGHASPREFVDWDEMEELGYNKESVFTRS